MSEYLSVIRSPLSQTVKQGALTVRIEIFKVDGTDGWTLEEIDREGNVTVWLEVFDTDAQAFAEFVERLENPGCRMGQSQITTTC